MRKNLEKPLPIRLRMSFDTSSAFSLPSRVEPFHFPEFVQNEVELWVKRDDLIHAEVQGNKWRKLNYNIQEAGKTGKQTILTMGGPWSNHLAATASACALLGFNSEAFVRGKISTNDYSATLLHCLKKGMKITFLEKHEYDRIKENGMSNLPASYYFIPEGGANALGVQGCIDILKEVTDAYDYIAAPVGSGTTCAGLALACAGNEKILCFNVFKSDLGLKKMIEEKIHLHERDELRVAAALDRLRIQNEYSFGGFAKTTPELEAFRLSLYKDTGIDTDLVYTTKMFFGIQCLLKAGVFKKGEQILVIHTGGLQGNQGFQQTIND